MEKEFNFDNIGKKMPYPDEKTFLNKFSSSTIIREKKKRRNISLLKIVGIAVSIMLIFATPYLLLNENKNNHSIDELISAMSNEDLEILMSISNDEINNNTNLDYE